MKYLNSKFNLYLAFFVVSIFCVVFSQGIFSKERIKDDVVVKTETKGWNYEAVRKNNITTTTFHAKWVNYLDSDNQWKDINLSLEKTETGFLMNNAPFQVKLPLFSDGQAIFVNQNRYNPTTKKPIVSPSLDMKIEALETTKVEGLLEYGNLLLPSGIEKNVEYVVYKNAYENADLIYYLSWRKAPRLEKLIRFHQAPSTNTYSFLLEFDKQQITKEKKKIKNRKTENIIFGLENSASRKISFGDFQIWDSQNNMQPVSVDLQEIKNNQFILSKNIDAAFWEEELVFPVYTDASTSFMPDPNTEVTSVDGVAVASSTNSWNVAHDAIIGNAYDSSAVSYVTSQYNGSAFQIYRSFFLFDTSSLESNVVIESAKLKLHFTGFWVNQDDDGYDYIAVVNSSPANNTSLVNSDFDQCGDIDNPQLGSEKLDFGDMTGNTYNELDLNTAGISWIEKDGITKFGVREGHDIEDHPIESSSPTNNEVGVYHADQGGTSKDPVLIVESRMRNVLVQ